MQEQTAPAGSVGHRIAVARTLARLSAQQLAIRAELSVSLISQVEDGMIPASPALTAAVARALGVDVETLYGQPYGPAITDPKADHAGIPVLRAALHHGYALAADARPGAEAETAWSLLADAYLLAQTVAYHFGYRHRRPTQPCRRRGTRLAAPARSPRP